MNPTAIRSLLEAIENLAESTGLAGRKPGDKFIDPATKDELEFQELKFYPENGGRFEPEQLQDAIKTVNQDTNNKIYWENKLSPKTGGFAIAVFKRGNDTIYTGRYMDKVNPNPRENFIPNVIMGKYNYGAKAAVKTRSGLSPQDLLTKQNDLTIPEIMNQLAQSLGTSHICYHIAHHIASGGTLPASWNAPDDVSFTAFRDYFCEILQPMALQKGQYDGNAGEAANRFLKPEGFAGAKINFGGSKNEGLQDSNFTLADGRKVKISSKAGKGATATVKNLYDSVQEMKSSPEGQALAQKYSEVIDILENIVKEGQAGSPLWLGKKYGIINNTEADTIKKLRGARPVNLLAPNAEEVMKSMGLSDRLIKFAKERGTDTPESTNLYYHLIASVAAKAADKINTKTNFSAAAADILNNGALVQVYTKASDSGGKWTLNEFHTVYPGTAVSGVLFTPGKTYYSTDIKGNFTFKILSGGQTAKQAAEVTESVENIHNAGRARRSISKI